MSHSKEFQELSRQLADTKKAKSDAEEAQLIMLAVKAAFDWMEESGQDNDATLMMISPTLRMYLSRVDTLMHGRHSQDPEWVETMRNLSSMANEMAEWKREVTRAERLAKRSPVQEVVMEGRKCSRCNKRQAKFGTLCGRCAEETGQREKGKV